MLKRLVTGIALALLVTAAIFLLPGWAFSALIGLAMLVGAREWVRLGALGRGVGNVFMVLTGAAMGALGWLYFQAGITLAWVLVASVLWWFLALAWLGFYSQRIRLRGLAPPLIMLIGLLLLVPAWYGLTLMHGHGDFGPVFVFFYLFVNSWADSGAYFVGRKLGRTKLAPIISPGKTWEGVAGGVAAVCIVTVAGSWLMDLNVEQFLRLLPLCILVIPFSILGDLLESLCKRQAGVKDSGQLLPGHGGMLDRVDSITATGPLFMLGLLLLEGWF